MCWMVRSSWHLLSMGGGSLPVKNEWAKKECPILARARMTSCYLFKKENNYILPPDYFNPLRSLK